MLVGYVLIWNKMRDDTTDYKTAANIPINHTDL